MNLDAPRTPNPPVSPTLSLDYVLAPVGDNALMELQDLAPQREDAAHLRRAWILLEGEQWVGATDACAQVIYSPASPSAKAKALAHYIRAECLQRRGQPELGRYDRDRAMALALDRKLRARIAATAGSAQPEPGPAKPRRLAIQSRSSWRPDPAITARLNPMGRIYRLTVHHSAMYFRSVQPRATAAQLRVIQRDHMRNPDRLYGDIGYHYLVDPAGRIWEGRPLEWQGAHARLRNNRGNIGICILGNFVRGGGGQRPNQQQLRALRSLVHDLTARYSISGKQIWCHNDFVATRCPGPYLRPVVEQLKNEVRTAALARQRDETTPAATNN